MVTPLRYGIFESHLRWLIERDCVDFALTQRVASHIKGVHYWQVTAYVVELDRLMQDKEVAQAIVLQSTPFEAIPVLMRELSPLQFELLGEDEQIMAFKGAERASGWLQNVIRELYPDDQAPFPGTDPVARPFENLQFRIPAIGTIYHDSKKVIAGGETWRQ